MCTKNIARVGVMTVVCLGLLLVPLAGAGTALVERPAVIKPAHTEISEHYRDDVVSVQFADGLNVRVRDDALTDFGGGALDELGALLTTGRWERPYAASEEQLERWRTTAEENLGREVADLNLQYYYWLPEGADVEATLDALNALDCVEIALPMPRPVPPPLPPNYQASQGYLNAATTGIDALGMWGLPGGAGDAVAVADLEYSWNFSHNDLQNVGLLGAMPNDPYNDTNHGTAVLGELVGVSNGWGVTGATHHSAMYVVATNTGPGSGVWDVGAAVTTALGRLGPGDVILIEQQMAGPNYTGSPPGTQFGLVPVEWYLPWYNAIVTAVGNDVIVVEAAGNGQQDLDAAIYSTGNGGHWPFLPQNDSGAIIAGAGAVPAAYGGTDTARSRLWFSNYGSTVDLQGWGEQVVTTGYNDLYAAEGPNLWYTAAFGGTSSASPIVASACATLSSAFKVGSGYAMTLSPAQAKQLLQSTGSPQTSGTYPSTENIGPLPDTTAAFGLLLSMYDCNGNGVFDSADVINGTSFDCNYDGIPDECQPPIYTGGPRLYVDALAIGTNDGSSWMNAYTNLDTALCVAASYPGVTEIWVAGTLPYRPRAGSFASDARTATFQLVNGVAVYGGFMGGETQLNQRMPQANVTVLSGDLWGDDLPGFMNTGDNAYHVVTASGCDPTAMLDGFTIRAGEATGPGFPQTNDRGGGIYALNGSPTIRQCVIEFNRATIGGGFAFVSHSSPVLDTCVVHANESMSGGGGGGWFDSAGQPILTNCQFIANWAHGGGDGAGLLSTDNVAPLIVDSLFVLNNATGAGGGLAIGGDDGCAPAIVRTLFEQNSAQFEGGGMVTLYGARPQVSESRFIQNTAGGNGAGAGSWTFVSANGAAPTYTNCAFIGNQTLSGYGGGIDVCIDSSATITNCSFSFNQAMHGCSVSLQNLNGTESCTVTNSILWNMTGPEIYEAVPGPVVTVNYSDVTTPWPGIGNHSVPPEFADFDGPDNMPGNFDDNLRIRGFSLLIDAGDNDADIDGWSPGGQGLPAVDLAGRPRRMEHGYVPDTGNPGAVGAPVVDMGAYEHVVGDFNFDDLIDLTDFSLMEGCLGGPGIPGGAGCVDTDITLDNDTDMEDFREFQRVYGS